MAFEETRGVSHLTRIWVGTSGFHFPDWEGVFYPQGVPKKNWLTFYVENFRVLEINSSYYRIPSASSMRRVADAVPVTHGVTVKAHRSSTHEFKDVEAAQAFRESVEPLADKGLLRGVLAQFPWSFQKNADNLYYLRGMLARSRDLPWFVEFRHRSWLVPEIGAFLRENGVGYVSVDEPQIGNMMPAVAKYTIPTAYVRLHGRNARAWWGGDGADRYDYRYQDDELEEWVAKVGRITGEVRDVLIFFNNCKGGSAAINAKTMRELLKRLPGVEVL